MNQGKDSIKMVGVFRNCITIHSINLDNPNSVLGYTEYGVNVF